MTSFVTGYIDAMFFTEAHDDNEELADATEDDLSPAALEQINADCEAFQEDNNDDLTAAYANGRYSESAAGTDFWFTRNGHGAGFWDRGLGAVGDRLTTAAHAYGSENLYRGDDGQLYFS